MDDKKQVWPAFDFGKVTNPGLVAIVACRGQGATTLQHAILNGMPLTTRRRGFVMQPTPEAFVSHADHVPIAYIHDHYDETFLQQLHNFQSDKTSNPMFALFDSVSSDPVAMKSKLLTQCLTETDKLKWLAILNAQYAMDIPAGTRDHVQWWFLGPTTLDQQRQIKMLQVSTADAARLRLAFVDAQTTRQFVVVPGKSNRDSNKPLAISMANVVEAQLPANEETEAKRWSDAAFDEVKFELSISGKPPIPSAAVGKRIDPEFAILMNPAIVTIASTPSGAQDVKSSM